VVRPEIILCDLDGVVWLGGTPIAGSVAAVARLRASGRRVVFVTNSSAVTIAEHTAVLAAVGIEATGDVISSATAAAALIEPGQRVLVCGGRGVTEAVQAAGATAVAGDDDAGAAGGIDAVVVGLHREFDYHRLHLAASAVRLGARFIATNLDPIYPTVNGPTPGGGVIAAAVATASGGVPVTAGKPHPPMAKAVRAMVGEPGETEQQLAARVVMIGDQVSTDGLFAVELGCRFALVRSGNTAPGAPVDLLPAYDAADLAGATVMILAGSTPTVAVAAPR